MGQMSYKKAGSGIQALAFRFILSSAV